MSDKALSMNRATLELTQKIQTLFPTDIRLEILTAWNGCPKDVLVEKLADVFGSMPPPLLCLCGTEIVSADAEKFIAREWLAINATQDELNHIIISIVGDCFQEWFLDKVEEPVLEPAIYRYSDIFGRRMLADSDILGELDVPETSLRGVFSLIKRHKRDETCVLLDNVFDNIFYVKDIKNILRKVVVRWEHKLWSILADEIGSGKHIKGCRVFSVLSL